MNLRGNDDLVATGEFLQKTTEYLLTCATGIDVGCIKHVDARFDSLPNEGATRILVHCPIMSASLGISISHAAEEHTRDIQSCRAELHIFHDVVTCFFRDW